MVDSVSGGVPIVCALSIACAVFAARLRSRVAGFIVAMFAPLLVSFLLAWLLMSPVLHRSAEYQGGWDLVATLLWSLWGVPVGIASFMITRWRLRLRKGNAL